MKVLLDVGVSPRLCTPLQVELGGVPVESAIFRQWRALRDDELLLRAWLNGFTALVTTDKRLAEQQRHPSVAIVTVDDNRLAGLMAAVADIALALRSSEPGERRFVAVRR